MPEITVAITTYNLEKHIHNCLDELKRQTFQDFEILVYDDCSNDATRSILVDHQKLFRGKMTIIFGTVPQKSPGKARNMILNSQKITGKYCVFLDGDDSIEPDFLEKLYLAAENEKADLSLCAYDRFENSTGHILCQEMRGYPAAFCLEDDASPNLAFINTSLWNKLIRTDCIGNLRFPEFSVGEDASFLQAVYIHTKKIACVNEVLIHYRVRSNSVISNTPEESIYNFAKEFYRLWELADSQRIKDSIALSAFVHIGLSMPLRAYDNPKIDTKTVLIKIRQYFAHEFCWFRGNQFFNLKYLISLGMKGIGCFGALLLHRIGCFSIFLLTYKTVTKTFGIDIKF